jgi:hypothetical protein
MALCFCRLNFGYATIAARHIYASNSSHKFRSCYWHTALQIQRFESTGVLSKTGLPVDETVRAASLD